MTELLTDLLNVGLIDKLDGDDDRFTKMERAAEVVAQELRDHPPLLIRAILAGLDPDIPADDPAIVQAERALITEWKSMRSVHTDSPVNLLRAILLAACNQAADDGTNAAILWLMSADTLPMLLLGKEEPVIRRMLASWAERTEEAALINQTASAENAEQAMIEAPEPTAVTAPKPRKVDRETLLARIAAAAGPNYKNQPSPVNPNPHWSNAGQNWSWEFSDRMNKLLADELDGVVIDVIKSQTESNKRLQAYLTEFNKTLNETLNSQRRWMQKSHQAEQIRLNALWWAEALYSSSLTCSYRELPQSIATVVMAIDMLGEVTKPTPASVGYLLAEAVNRLPEAGFDRKHTLRVILESLAKDRDRLSKEWQGTLIQPPETGRLSLRDLVILILAGNAPDINAALTRTGTDGEIEMSLPKFAHALFRQEQAVLLAGSGQ